MPGSATPGYRWKTILVVLLLITGVGGAQAVDFNTTQQQQHQMWQSLVVQLGSENHVRAIESSSYSDAMLSINTTPGRCLSPWLEMRSDLGENQSLDDRVNDVPADVLVGDHYTLTGRAELLTERGDNGLYVRFYDLDMPTLLQQMREGDELHLRIRMTEDVEDYWFMTFSLAGAEDALSRMNQLCFSLG
ncbi:hypothetical protein [Halomonas huangheensis]|uniref:Uncharacterized protein n=1 Tax=Halomonas huangheensis TaxID=1178482 RepID=W1N760_9GAMM|nr:hypothetical protein [Halomonas huangheensis]ALM54226.1 hypothetical protein AR456_19605 [Halomonas huangheensis]ERL50770.1 hypothetical protein BJB45_19435 [Halomonas huangheensis]